MALTCVFACLGVGLFVASNKTVNASAATQEELVAEFTQNGLFTVSAVERDGCGEPAIIDGKEAKSSLPAGYTGAVLEMDQNPSTNGYDFINLDFSASRILASDVKSIVVKIWAENYTSDDEFRTIGSVTGSQRQYRDTYKIDLDAETWKDITLNAHSIADMTDANGYLASIELGIREKSSATHVYIDSITVNLIATYELGPTCLHESSIPGGTNRLYLTLPFYKSGVIQLDEAGNEKEFTWVGGTGVLVNGVQISPIKLKQASKRYFRFYADTYGIEAYLKDGTTPDEVTVGGTFENKETGIRYIFEDSTIWDGTTWAPKYTVDELGSLTFTHTSSGKTNQLYFQGENAVKLALGGRNNVHWDAKYSLKAGSGVGIVLNGEALDLSAITLKFPGSVFIDLTTTPAVNSTLTIGGTFYSITTAQEYVIEESEFVWNGSAWVDAASAAPVEYTIHNFGKLVVHNNSNGQTSNVPKATQIYMAVANGTALPYESWDIKFDVESGAGWKLNGEPLTLTKKLVSSNAGLYIDLTEANVQVGDVLSVEGTFVCDSVLAKYVIAESKFQWNGTAWEDYVDYTTYTVTKLGSTAKSTAEVLYLYSDAGDLLPKTEGDWDAVYTLVSGGVKLNDTVLTTGRVKLPGDLYLPLNVTAEEGDVLTIDATYVNAAKAHKFVFVNCQLQWNGTAWVEYVAPIEYETYEIGELKLASHYNNATVVSLQKMDGTRLENSDGKWYAIKYVSGTGVTLNGTQIDMGEIKIPSYIYLALRTTAEEGDILVVEGTFRCEELLTEYVIDESKFVFNGTTWEPYVEYTVHEIGALALHVNSTVGGAKGDNTVVYLKRADNGEFPILHWEKVFVAENADNFKVNGVAHSLTKVASTPDGFYWNFGEALKAGDYITISGTFVYEAELVKYVIEESTFTWTGSAWTEGMPVVIDWATYTVTEIAAAANSSASIIEIYAAQGDALPKDKANWSDLYTLVDGEGFSLNDTPFTPSEIKFPNDLRIVLGVTVNTGDVLTINGTFTNENTAVKMVFVNCQLKWDGSAWVANVVTPEPPALEYETYTVTKVGGYKGTLSQLYVYSLGGDNLPKEKVSDDWANVYTVTEGSITLNGEARDITDIKFPGDLFIGLGFEPKAGDVIALNCTLVNDTTLFKFVFVNCELKWNGEAWVENVVTPEPPVVEYTVHELGALDFHANVNAGGNGIIYLKRADNGALPVLDWQAAFEAENAENFKINGVAANCLEIKSTSDGFFWKFNKLNAGDYITISGTFVCESKLVKYVIEESKFVWNGSAWDKYVDYAVYNVGSIYSSSGSTTALYIAKTSGPFEVTEGTWTEKLTFLAGSGVGITLNGKQISMNDIKIPNTIYIGLGTTAKVGDVLAISGTFYNANLAVKYIIEYHEFTWTGASWALTFNDELLEEYDFVTPIDLGLGSTVNISGTFDGAGLSYVTSPANTTGSLKFRFGYRTSDLANDEIWFRLRGGAWEGDAFRIIWSKVGPLSKESYELTNNTDHIIEFAAIDLKDGSGTWIYVSVDGVIIYSAKHELSTFHTSHLSIHGSAANATISAVGIVEISYETESGTVTEYVEEDSYYKLPEGRTANAFIGWLVDGELYFAGEELLIGSQALKITALEVEFTMDDGAAIRITNSQESSGIRFTSRINAEQLEALQNQAGIESVTYGTIILPYDYLVAGQEPNLEDTFENILNIPNEYTEVVDGYAVFRGAMIDVLVNNYDRFIAGRAYMQITLEGGDVITLYTPFSYENNVRSIRYVAQQFKKDTGADFNYDGLSDERKAIVDAYAGTTRINLIDYTKHVQDSFNVTAWYYPELDPSNQYNNTTNDEIAQEMIDAGIKTVILDGAHHIDLNVPENVVKTRQMIRFFWLHGIKTVVFGSNAGTDPNLDWATMGYPDFSDCEGFEGFLVWDEPQTKNNAQLAEFAKEFEKTYAGTDVTFMVNLLPSYATIFNTGSTGWFDATIDKLKKSDYQAYLKNYCDTVLSQVSGEKWLSMDSYPINADYTLSSYFLFDLAMLKYYAEYAGATSHAVLQSSGWVEGEHDDKNRMPTAAEMEMQAYTAMAFGIDSISWWSYSDKRGDQQNNPTDNDDYMSSFAAVNSELNKVSAVYSAFDWKGVILGAGKDNGYLFSKDDDYEAFAAVKGQIGSYELTVSNTKHLASVSRDKTDWNYVMGVMEDVAGNEAYVLCNYNSHKEDRTQTITITFASNITEVIIYRDGVAQTVSVSSNKTLAVKLATGEGVIIIPSKLG